MSIKECILYNILLNFQPKVFDSLRQIIIIITCNTHLYKSFKSHMMKLKIHKYEKKTHKYVHSIVLLWAEYYVCSLFKWNVINSNAIITVMIYKK